MGERLQLLRDRYTLFLGPLVLLMAIGIASAAVLAWVAGILLLLLTLNKLVGLAAKK
ncbi:hypothetical protein HZY97_12710 [Sphingomonas sp. R-74633]|uniref:hypothetical protein n=1 Tax=Sphingomonas sp. R-74633 TaxID=2751188 RepID=UPI0015D2082C|nr:hypothetical protein [Sphingomonas sp. R-74633]NYT41625.1 hypothetical protein [Sphingomonas sp. R-74633]